MTRQIGFGEPKLLTRLKREEANSIQPRGVLWFLFFSDRLSYLSGGGIRGEFALLFCISLLLVRLVKNTSMYFN